MAGISRMGSRLAHGVGYGRESLLTSELHFFASAFFMLCYEVHMTRITRHHPFLSLQSASA